MCHVLNGNVPRCIRDFISQRSDRTTSNESAISVFLQNATYIIKEEEVNVTCSKREDKSFLSIDGGVSWTTQRRNRITGNKNAILISIKCWPNNRVFCLNQGPISKFLIKRAIRSIGVPSNRGNSCTFPKRNKKISNKKGHLCFCLLIFC